VTKKGERKDRNGLMTLRYQCHGSKRSSEGQGKAAVACDCGWTAVIKQKNANRWKVKCNPLSEHGLKPVTGVTDAAHRHFVNVNQPTVDPQTASYANPTLSNDAKAVAKELFAIGFSVDVVDAFLSNSGIQKTWTQQMLHNLRSRQRTAINKNACLADGLIQLKSIDGVFLRWECDSAGAVLRLYWMLPLGQKVLRYWHHVFTFDPTYNTNNLGMPLHLFTTITSSRSGIIVAGAVTIQERILDFEWVMTQHRTALTILHLPYPEQAIIDGDEWLRTAFKSVFPNCRIQLGNWHHMESFHGHFPGEQWALIRPLYYDALTAWTPQLFDVAWAKLVEAVNADQVRFISDHCNLSVTIAIHLRVIRTFCELSILRWEAIFILIVSNSPLSAPIKLKLCANNSSHLMASHRSNPISKSISLAFIAGDLSGLTLGLINHSQLGLKELNMVRMRTSKSRHRQRERVIRRAETR